MNLSKRNWFTIDPFFGTDFVDLRKEIEQMFSNQIKDIQSNPPKELIREYESQADGKVREIGPFVYGYSITIGQDGRPKIREFGNIKNRSQSSVDTSHPYSREPLIDLINNEKEVKILVELPGVRKESIKITAFEDYLEITANDDRRYHQKIDLPNDIHMNSAKSTYKNGILEIVFLKKNRQHIQRKKD